MNTEKTSVPAVDLSQYQHESQFSSRNLRNIFWYLCNGLFLKTLLPIPMGFKRWLLRQFGARIGPNVVIKPDVNIKFPWLLEVGANTWIGEGVWIDNLVTVKIGANVCLSQGALLLCGNHDYSSPRFTLMTRPITLEDGVWIGARAVVCPGVTARSHAVLAVGSVASRELDAYSIYQGNPALKIRDRKITSPPGSANGISFY